MGNDIRFFYHKAAWTFAFGSPTGNTSRIVFDTQGSVYKDTISFDNLVVSFDGIVGPAGRSSDGQITIWNNSHDGTFTGLVHAMIESPDEIYTVNGGTIETDQYFHFIIKIDNINKLVTLKINNVVVDTAVLKDGVNLFNKVQKSVLFHYLDFDIEDHRYRGKVDDFRIYDFVTSDQQDKDVFDWGNQKLQFEKKIYVPSNGNERGCSAGLKIESKDFVQIRNLGIEFTNINIR